MSRKAWIFEKLREQFDESVGSFGGSKAAHHDDTLGVERCRGLQVHGEACDVKTFVGDTLGGGLRRRDKQIGTLDDALLRGKAQTLSLCSKNIEQLSMIDVKRGDDRSTERLA